MSYLSWQDLLEEEGAPEVPSPAEACPEPPGAALTRVPVGQESGELTELAESAEDPELAALLKEQSSIKGEIASLTGKGHDPDAAHREARFPVTVHTVESRLAARKQARAKVQRHLDEREALATRRAQERREAEQAVARQRRSAAREETALALPSERRSGPDPQAQWQQEREQRRKQRRWSWRRRAHGGASDPDSRQKKQAKSAPWEPRSARRSASPRHRDERTRGGVRQHRIQQEAAWSARRQEAAQRALEDAASRKALEPALRGGEEPAFGGRGLAEPPLRSALSEEPTMRSGLTERLLEEAGACEPAPRALSLEDRRALAAARARSVDPRRPRDEAPRAPSVRRRPRREDLDARRLRVSREPELRDLDAGRSSFDDFEARRERARERRRAQRRDSGRRRRFLDD